MQIDKNLLVQLQNAGPAVRGTTLITYMIGGSTDLWLATKHIVSELSTASNIKSKSVRKAVISALKSLQVALSNYPGNKTPPNGLVMLSGNLSDSIEYYV